MSAHFAVRSCAQTLRSDLFSTSDDLSRFGSTGSSASSADDDPDITAETIYMPLLTEGQGRQPPAPSSAAPARQLSMDQEAGENGSIVMSVPQSTNPVSWGMSPHPGGLL